MKNKNYLEYREAKLLDFSELSQENLTNENTETKLKKRKSKIFLIMSNRRRGYMNIDSNINLNLNNTANFIKIFNLIKNKEEKSNLINYLFENKIPKVKNLLSKYQKVLNLIIDYNFLSTSNFILDIIEKNDEIIELIVKKRRT
jgi:prenyltransferase beta subunit